MIDAGGQHFFQGFGAHKRGVAVKHDRLALGLRQQGCRLRNGMGGAKLGVLQDGFGGLVKGLGGAGHGVRAMAGDDDHAGRLQRAAGSKGVVQHRHAGKRVQHLGQVGVHPGAETCGQDDQ